MPRTIAMAACAVVVIVLGAGSIGYVLSARASTSMATNTGAAEVPATLVGTMATATGATAATAAPIPVFAASALPEAPPVTPASLPEAKPPAP